MPPKKYKCKVKKKALKTFRSVSSPPSSVGLSPDKNTIIDDPSLQNSPTDVTDENTNKTDSGNLLHGDQCETLTTAYHGSSKKREVALIIDAEIKTPSSSTDNIAPTETATTVHDSTVLTVRTVVHGVVEDVVPVVFPISVLGAVPGTVSTQEAVVLSSEPLLTTHDNVQLVAVHSPDTAKNLRKTRIPRKKALRIASPKKNSPSKLTTAKYVFLNDPTKAVMLQLNQNHISPLIN
jgi:hypothetical protein